MNEENLSMPRCDIVRLQNEIKQLKVLLKECMPYVVRNVVFTAINRGEVVDLKKNELLTKIEEVLK